MYENIKISKPFPTSPYLPLTRYKIPIEEIEDIFLELVDVGFIFGLVNAHSRGRIESIIHTQPAVIHIIDHVDKPTGSWTFKSPRVISDKNMQKFITRLEYLNIKVGNIKTVNNYSLFHVEIECAI